MSKRIVIALLTSTSVLFPIYANAVIPVTEDGPLLATAIKDSVIQAKQFALEVKGWVDVANTYATAAQNTIAIPMAAIAQINSLYYRAKGISDAVGSITGPNSTMMQRFTMLQGIGKGAAGLPGEIAYNADFWNQQRQRQMEEDSKLLGLEEERKAIEDAFLTTAQQSSAHAVGQLAAIQAQGQVTAAAASQLQHTNQMMQKQAMDQQVKTAMQSAQEQSWQDAREADVRAQKLMIATPANYAATPIIWGR